MATPSEAETFEYLHWKRRLDPPYYVNSTAISADGKLVVAGTFFHPYKPPSAAPPAEPTGLPNQFGTYLFDREGKQLWADKFVGYEGVYAVAISGDGSTAASGGWFSNEPSFQGYIRAYATAKGPEPVLDFKLGTRVNALAFSADGSTLIAAADNVYLFQKSDGVFPQTPVVLQLNPSENAAVPNSAQAVAVTSDGGWILVGDYIGNVYLVENNAGQLGKPYIWSNKPSLTTIHCVALTPDGQWFAAGGDASTLYLFSFSSMTGGTPANAGAYTLDTGGRVGWAAISDDGGFLSAIGNKSEAGAVVALQNNDGTLSRKWEEVTLRNPNSTSMDASANFVSVADGYPDGTNGHFSLYEGATGKLLWRYQTLNMNWPMFVSADGSGIVAGTDNGNVFYFTPRKAAE